MLRSIFRNAGIRPDALANALRGWRRYADERRKFLAMQGGNDLPWGRELPILTEWNETSAGLHAYFFQDLIVARWVLDENPERHVDVGSRIDGFIGHLAAVREVDVIDIRPQPLRVPNVKFHQLDVMNDLPEGWIGSTDSLSCLHTIEHFGLGRYGDALDPEGHLKGIAQLKRMVRPGGILYLSTPVGHERIEFNAHRIFAPATLRSWFDDEWAIERSALVDDSLEIHEAEGHHALDAVTCDAGVGIIRARKSELHGRDGCPQPSGEWFANE